jgi:hypothetical protein
LPGPIAQLAINHDENLVDEPRIARLTLTSFQCLAIAGAKFKALATNGFLRDDYSSFDQQILNNPIAHIICVPDNGLTCQCSRIRRTRDTAQRKGLERVYSKSPACRNGNVTDHPARGLRRGGVA